MVHSTRERDSERQTRDRRDETDDVNDEPARIAEVAAHYAGRCVVVGEFSWPHRESTVVELETATGERLIGKAHRQEVKFEAEHIAYQRWVPSLGHRAPHLLHADAEAGCLCDLIRKGRDERREQAQVIVPFRTR